MNTVMGHSLMRKDGSDHLAERRAVEPAFRPAVAMEHCAPKIERLADELIRRFEDQGEVDLFNAFTAPMAAIGLTKLLGLKEDVPWQDMCLWSQLLMDGVGNFSGDPEITARGMAAAEAIAREIERDTATDTPNGILAEAATAGARALVNRTDGQMADALREAARYFNSLGITAFKEPLAYEADLQVYHAGDVRGDLTLHMAAHIVRSSPLGGDVVPFCEMDRLRQSYRSDNICLDFAKLFLDGVAPGFTASFTDPYLATSGYAAGSHDPDATLLIEPDTLDEMLIKLDWRGFTVKMHAVGDNAIRKGLDGIAAARDANGPSGLRHEVAHSNFVSDADLVRFKALGAVAEMSPKMWFPNPGTAVHTALLGAERVQKNHRIRDLHLSEAEMIYGSDWPAAAPDANPWTGLSGMLT